MTKFALRLAEEQIATLREALSESANQKAELLEASSALLDAVRKHTVLGRGDWLNGLESDMSEAIRKASR